MTNSIEELENSDVILLTGTNTTEMHPVIASYMKRAVRKGRTGTELPTKLSGKKKSIDVSHRRYATILNT